MEATNSDRNITKHKIFPVEAIGVLLLFGKILHLTEKVYDNSHCQKTPWKLLNLVLMVSHSGVGWELQV